MQIQILQDTLAQGLNTVSRYTSTRGQLPILANVLIDAQPSGITLLATNLEIGIRVEIGGKVIKPGQITVPAKNLTEFVASLPPVTVELKTDNEKLKITTDKSSAALATIDAKEFPIIPRVEDPPASLDAKHLRAGQGSGRVEVDSQTIKEIATQVAFAAAVDESRPVLTGVKFMVRGSSFMVVATDGFRLSQKLLSTTNHELPTIILPARTILELSRVVTEGQVQMQTVPANNQAIFVSDKTQIISRILEGNFPDVEKIIPKEFKTRAIVDRNELLRTIRTAGIFARENNNIIKFIVQSSELIVKADGGQTGENESTLEAEVEGDDLQIAFNYKYLLDFLNCVDEERVILNFNESMSPGVFLPEKDSSLIHLIMPVRV